MTTLVPSPRHPALDVPEAERLDYLRVVASMAFADREVVASEIERLRELCGELEIGEAGTRQVLAAAKSPSDVAIDALVRGLAESELRFALLVDAVDLACADHPLNPSEATEIEHLADVLGITHGQVALVRRYVAERRGLRDESDSGELGAALAAAGVPAAMIAVAGVAGIPLIAGVGLAAALGAGSYAAVKWLHHRFDARE